MKSRRILSLAIVLIVVVLSLGIVYTNAKYTSTVTGNVSASVAKYVFNLTGTDSYNSKHTLSNLVLGKTCKPETLIDGKIAPGTSGSFDLIVKTMYNTGRDLLNSYRETSSGGLAKYYPVSKLHFE